MNFAQRLRLCWYAAAIVLAEGSATANLSSQQVPLARADSEVFEAVVRSELAGGGKDYPYRRDSVRFDSRPSGSGPDFQSVAGGSRGFDPSEISQHADSATLDILARNRRQILKLAGVEEGKPSSYPNCGGTLAPPPPPPPAGSAGADGSSRPAIHAECPKRSENYMAVGLPIRGMPEGLKNLPGSKGQKLDFTGELWTVIVDERYVGPGGQNWFQHAWLFRRSPSTGRLELAHTFLLAWEE